MMILELEFQIGDEVYLKTDDNQLKRIITGLYVTQNEVIYYLSQGITETKHYSFELSLIKDYKIT